MIDVMVDIETLGNKNSPVIIQIAAVVCNLETGETFDSFNMSINPMSCVKAGLDVDGDTVNWWLTQDYNVIESVFVESILTGCDLFKALKEFGEFITNLRKKDKKLRIWGNGVLADNKWLESAYDAVGLSIPWKYNENTDVRTLVDLGIRVGNINPKKDITFDGNPHDAIDDCLHQIRYCSAIFNELNSKKA